MNMKLIIAALAVPLLTMGAAPQDVEAKPKKQIKKAIKKHHKRYHNNHHDRYKVNVRHHYPKYRSPYKTKEVESFGLYTTPGGGLGIHYSENSYQVPRYGYGYPGYYY